MGKDLVRADGEKNRQEVTKALMKYFEENNQVPTLEEIAQETGLSIVTVQKHMANVSFEEYFPSIQRKTVQLVEGVIISVYRRAIAGDMRAAKLFFQLQGWVEKQDVKKEENITFKIIKETIHKAPEVAAEEADYTVEGDNMSLQAVPVVLEASDGQEDVSMPEGSDSGKSDES